MHEEGPDTSEVEQGMRSRTLSRRDRMVLALEHQGHQRLRRLGTALYRLTNGRIAPSRREVLLLTTRGRKSGQDHTMLLQGFRVGTEFVVVFVVVAANSGRASPPD